MTKCTEARRLLERAVVALRFYANPRNWKEDDWGMLSVVQGAAYGKPTEKAQRVKRAIDAFLADTPACDAEKAALVAALEDARMLCMNDHAYDNETSQVFEAVQVINRALADRPPAAAALLPQGRETE